MSFMNLNAIEQAVNAELNNVHDWLTTNRLTLNTKQINFFYIFCPRQKKNAFFSTNKYLDRETSKKGQSRRQKVTSINI